jgi:hypothetical protein
MLLGATGDALLMKLLRHVAKTKGLCLNEYGMGEKYDAEDQVRLLLFLSSLRD